MGARRKQIQIAEPIQDAPRHGPASNHGDLEGGVNQALAVQRMHLEAAFSPEEADIARYPGAVRMAIILGGSACLWAIGAGVVHTLLTL